MRGNKENSQNRVFLIFDDLSLFEYILIGHEEHRADAMEIRSMAGTRHARLIIQGVRSYVGIHNIKIRRC